MNALESLSALRLVWPVLTWAAVVVAWAAACLQCDIRPTLGPGRPSRWRALLPFFGPVFLIGTLQFGQRITLLGLLTLGLVCGLIIRRETDFGLLVRTLKQTSGGSDGSPLSVKTLGRAVLAWLRSNQAEPGQPPPTILVRKDGTPFGQQDIGDQGSAALQRTQEILGRAVAANATDVHLEPTDGRQTQLRFRIDGMMQPVEMLTAGLGQAVVSILKVVADMDIAERRRPQDGTFVTLVGQRRFDVRAASGPTAFGEKMALRLLDVEGTIIQDGLDGIGMPAMTAEQLRDIVSRSQGMLIVCGPTGSGKTTSLYALLREMDTLTRNVVTIEDPIEYRLENISQTAVNTAAELTFGTILRSALRQDPDVILVGEIRDKETAEIAMQAALTGHLVLTTLHANDTATTVTRLMDIGIEIALVQSTVTGILAQRLLRCLCPACKIAYPPPEAFLASNRIRPGRIEALYREGGCSQCLQTGFRGRTGIYEFLPITGELRATLVGRPSLEDIRKAAAKGGVRTLRQAALRKVLEGVTSLAEAKRVTA
jgi:general secretion pathway protein E